jgi:hypothetical protein
MSTDRLLPLNAAAAEALLDGRGDGPPELVALLARATAPGHPVELGSEAAAVAHLRAAASVLTSPHPPATRRSALTRGFTVRAVAAAAVAALAVGGVAIAATVGALPSGSGDDTGRGAVGPQSSVGGGAVATGPGAGGARPTDGTSAPGPTATAALRGLCTAYTKAVAANPGKAAQNPAFSALIAAAGGVELVPQFCARLAAGPSTTPSPSSAPGAGSGNQGSDPGKSGDHPTPHPTGKPSRHPGSNGAAPTRAG